MYKWHNDMFHVNYSLSCVILSNKICLHVMHFNNDNNLNTLKYSKIMPK